MRVYWMGDPVLLLWGDVFGLYIENRETFNCDFDWSFWFISPNVLGLSLVVKIVHTTVGTGGMAFGIW